MRPERAVRSTVVVLAIGLSLLLPACSRTSQSELDQAKAAGASEEAAKQKEKALLDEQARLAAEVKKLQEEAAKAKTGNTTPSTVTTTVPGKSGGQSGGSGGQSGSTACGGNLSVGPNTTCAFGLSVETEYYSAGGGTRSVMAYSPVTGKYYTMSCVEGVPTVCRGGNNAVVYIR